MAISLTDKAVREIKTIITQQSLPESTVLRLGVKGGGCSGFRYTLDLNQAAADDDEVFEYDGVKVVCDPKSYLYLNGTTVDFRDEVMGRGFVFDNPNASNGCGCGSSFSV